MGCSLQVTQNTIIVHVLAARHSFVFTARRVPGKSNAIADAISRFEFSAVPSANSLCVSHSNASTSFGLGPAACSLDQKCQFYLSNGLAPSTRQVYRSAQRQFIDFCTLDGYVSLNGSLLATNEKTLLRFCSHLAVVYITPQ